ncbi:MAG: hypothetical protein IIY60_05075 [Clostridia bacterium]|nr:hypothetical protein [Clostridia bacterium]
MITAIYLLAAFDTVLLINVAIDVARIKKMNEKIRLIEKNVDDLGFLMNKLVNKLCEIIGTKDGDGE